MKRQQALDTYDEVYASKYDDKFLLSDECRVGSDHEIEIVKQLLVPGGQWLDVACGTGYLLSHFPGVPRAGLDLAPAMLKLARQANPDALFFREGDFLQAVPEWCDQWALVTCMWYAYCLVESMTEVERVIANLAHWTSDEGVCFVPLCDPALLATDVHIPYATAQRFYGGNLKITGVIWTYVDESGVRHDNMVAPQVEHMVAMFGEYFSEVKVVEYPLYKPGRSPLRKAIVAKAKKRDVSLPRARPGV
jgi:SAM-dependent methyltransferase